MEYVPIQGLGFSFRDSDGSLWGQAFTPPPPGWVHQLPKPFPKSSVPWSWGTTAQPHTGAEPPPPPPTLGVAPVAAAPPSPLPRSATPRGRTHSLCGKRGGLSFTSVMTTVTVVEPERPPNCPAISVARITTSYRSWVSRSRLATAVRITPARATRERVKSPGAHGSQAQ